MANDMNRRGFLKYAAASALGMGALGVMTGCSSKETLHRFRRGLRQRCDRYRHL